LRLAWLLMILDDYGIRDVILLTGQCIVSRILG